MFHTLASSFLPILICLYTEGTDALSKTEKKQLRDEVTEMFYHAYNSYMNHAYPADELMPLTCKGRYRGSEPSRGDVDDSMGNFSLTLVDSFDTLVVLGDVEGFEEAVRLIIRDVHFDRDVVVSVFETNIRMLGGLLSGHVLAEMLHHRGAVLSWYRGELLELAKDLGYRLLPAFNTTTGIPFPRVNLRHGVKQVMARTGHEKDTCTACAGTMLLEFAALSRLTNEPLFEAKAHKAMDSLWQYRHRTSNLVGTVINIHNGEWVRRDSGIGAGIDSYYEYLLKAYILLGDDTYLDRFNQHYESIMRYINQGPLMLDVHMHRPNTNSKNFMDALFAFWPGLQVLKGDLKPAVEIHEMLYQVMQRHNFLPEAFTTDFRVHWGQHPLRPEFIESTYFLYRATGDPHYLDVGKQVVENLNKHARVDCGFAAIKDVTTGKHENQMDSFFLAETFKYLYLLFTEEEDLILNIDDFVFTTEAHLLPLTLSLHEASAKNISLSNTAVFYSQSIPDITPDDATSSDDYSNTCPNSAHLYKLADINTNYAQMFRHPLRNMVESACPKPRGSLKRSSRLKASEFIAGNKVQLQQLQAMGIRIITMNDGRVQLLHTASEASTPEDAEEGMQFMQDMIELSKTQASEAQQETRTVQILSQPHFGNLYFTAGPAQFGYDLKDQPGIKGEVVVADPLTCCTPPVNGESLSGKIVVVERGSCMFIDKARILEPLGAAAAIVIDGAVGSSSDTSPLFAMSGDGKNDVNLPMLFLFQKEGSRLLTELEKIPQLEVYLGKAPLNPDSVLRDVILKKANEALKEKEQQVTLQERLAVAVRRFDAEDEADRPGVRLTFHDASGERALFRIVHRETDNKFEFQFEKNALSLITKKKMSSLIEKVVGLIQANIDFGTMDLTEQSDYLFSLGKLMETSVSENSESLLEQRVRRILREDLHLNYDDVMEAVNRQESDLNEDSSDSKSTTELLRENIHKVLDKYVDDQLNQVYSEAEAFLHQLSQGSSLKQCSKQTDTDQTTDHSDLPQPYQPPGGPHNHQKIRFETRDGKKREAHWVDMSEGTHAPPGKENQEHFVSEKDLEEAYDKRRDLKDGRTGEQSESSPQGSGAKIHRPPAWMLLQDDEIFVDADNKIYTTYGLEEESETEALDENEDLNEEQSESEALDENLALDESKASSGSEALTGDGMDERENRDNKENDKIIEEPDSAEEAYDFEGVQGVLLDEDVTKHSVHGLEETQAYDFEGVQGVLLDEDVTKHSVHGLEERTYGSRHDNTDKPPERKDTHNGVKRQQTKSYSVYREDPEKNGGEVGKISPEMASDVLPYETDGLEIPAEDDDTKGATLDRDGFEMDKEIVDKIEQEEYEEIITANEQQDIDGPEEWTRDDETVTTDQERDEDAQDERTLQNTEDFITNSEDLELIQEPLGQQTTENNDLSEKPDNNVELDNSELDDLIVLLSEDSVPGSGGETQQPDGAGHSGSETQQSEGGDYSGAGRGVGGNVQDNSEGVQDPSVDSLLEVLNDLEEEIEQDSPEGLHGDEL